jgi:hypothetical protein
VAQITVAERVGRIRKLLNELNKMPPEKHEVIRITGFGDPMNCPVISIGAHELLLNHRSHRIRAQLQDDSQWDELKTDPQSEGAQDIIAFHIREDRGEEQFAALQQSLTRDGQTHPGIITHDGIIINGNTRAVAIREFPDPSRQYIRVAVLPETIKPQELNLLELRLQMQKELKREYSFTNELLFIEELKEVFGLPPEQIATDMRIHLDNPKKGAAEVELRLRMLDLIRKMQQIPVQRLPLRFFDALAYEQMKQTLREYDSRMKDDPAAAERYLESILLSGMLGVTSVHQLRRVDGTFVADYLVPHLEEDEIVGTFADALAAPAREEPKAGTPAGVSKLIKPGKASGAPGPNIRQLINIVNDKSKDIPIVSDGKKISLKTENVREALKNSLIVGINEKKVAERVEDKLSAPIDLLKKATNELVRCYDALPAAMKDSAFDTKRQKLMELAFKKLKKRYREVEAVLAKAGIIAEK